MIKVGITGGIGTGKSFVAHIFGAMGIPIYDADKQAKWLMQNDEALILAIKNTFGSDLYNEKNEIDRKKLGKIVFTDNNQLQKLNALVHPAVHANSEKWFAFHKKNGAKYVVKEAALIYETQGSKFLNKVIVVTAPLELRISRAMLRDRCTRQDVLDRIDKQLPEDEKIRQANFIIDNSENVPLLTQINKVHQAILSLK